MNEPHRESSVEINNRNAVVAAASLGVICVTARCARPDLERAVIQRVASAGADGRR